MQSRLKPALLVHLAFNNHNGNSKHIIQTVIKGKFSYTNVSQQDQLSVRRLLCTQEPALVSFEYPVCSLIHVWLKEKEFFCVFFFSSFFSWSAADHWLFCCRVFFALSESLLCRFRAMGKSHHSTFYQLWIFLTKKMANIPYERKRERGKKVKVPCLMKISNIL